MVLHESAWMSAHEPSKSREIVLQVPGGNRRLEYAVEGVRYGAVQSALCAYLEQMLEGAVMRCDRSESLIVAAVAAIP